MRAKCIILHAAAPTDPRVKRKVSKYAYIIINLSVPSMNSMPSSDQILAVVVKIHK